MTFFSRSIFSAVLCASLLIGVLCGVSYPRPPHGLAVVVGGGATQIFSYANFSGSPSIHVAGGGVALSGGAITFPNVSHDGGGAWYSGGSQVQNVQAFTTDFTFVIPSAGNYGMVFAIQNSNATTNPFGNYGINGGGYSANGLGWGAGGGSSQPAQGNSVGLVFSVSPFNQAAWYVSPTPISQVGLYVDGGPAIGGGTFGATNGEGYTPIVDTHPFGLNVASGNLIHAYLTYDGTTLTMVLVDTVTLATTRQSWPINIPAIVGANTAFIGFCQSQPSTGAGTVTVNSWTWSQGINTRLASPTFSVTPGQYSSTQTVSISGPAGAAIYYTTNGTPPTTASTLYTGAITVSSSQVINAVAVESNYTDSVVAQGLYLIQSGATPTINFPSGFASANGLIQYAGYGQLSSSSILLTDTGNGGFEASAAWFAAPVPVSTFTSTFTINTSSIGTGYAYGPAFILQNYPQTSTGTNYNWGLGNGPYGVVTVSGGPYVLGSPSSGTEAVAFGYVYMPSSIAVVFDVAGNSVGLYQNGAFPSGSQTSITGGVTFHTATAVVATLTYNGASLTLGLVQGANSFNTTLSPSINIPSILGASTGYAGFTGATGYAVGNVKVSAWTM
jgi:hypothetical protein